MKKLDIYLLKRNEILKEEKTITTLFNVEKELYRMLNARVFKPSEIEIRDIIKTCNELKKKLLIQLEGSQESNYIKEMSLDSISSCYHFVEKAAKILISTRKCNHPWYMAPIASTLTLGETLIYIAIIVTISLVVIK